MKNQQKIELVPYTPLWTKFFKKEETILKALLKNNLIQVHHIGSTAITSIKARPILDIVVEVHTLDGIQVFRDEFEKVGFTWMDLPTDEQRIEFVRIAPSGNSLLSKVLVYDKNSELINDYLDFRDYLNAEAELAKEYDKLKDHLNNQSDESGELYSTGKDEFIRIVLKNIT